MSPAEMEGNTFFKEHRGSGHGNYRGVVIKVIKVYSKKKAGAQRRLLLKETVF
jgi:hypothetical protein